MITIPGFKLHSVTVGCKHVRCFTLNSISGIIADFLLGECGADNHIFPKNHYEQVTFSPGQVRLTDEKELNIFDASWDQITIIEKVKAKGDEFNNCESVLKRAKSVFPQILNLHRDPNIVFLGIVSTFVQESTIVQPQTRYYHPVANFLSNLIPYAPKKGETSSNISFGHTYRCKINSSIISKGVDDYHNISLNIKDELTSNLWQDQGKTKDDVKVESDRTSVLSIDIQRIFDPRRKYDNRLFDEHVKFSRKHLDERIKVILKEISLGEKIKEVSKQNRS